MARNYKHPDAQKDAENNRTYWADKDRPVRMDCSDKAFLAKMAYIALQDTSPASLLIALCNYVAAGDKR